MNLRTLTKGLMATGALALLALGVNTSIKAQTSQTFDVTFATATGLTSAAGTDLDFGTWVINIQDTEDVSIIVPPTLGGGAPTTSTSVTAGGTPGQDSVVSNTVAAASSGTVTVTAPISTTLEIQGNVSTPFSATELSLGTLMFDTATESPTAIPGTYDGTTVTVASGGVAEEVAIGATLTIGDPRAENTTFGPAEITVSFRY